MKASIAAGLLVAAGLSAQSLPDRVGRLGFLYGAVSYRPGGSQGWADATPNLPLSDGDHIWTDLNAHAEVRAGAASVHLAPQTGASIVTLSDRGLRMSISEGSVNIRIARMNEGETVEFVTPLGAVRLLRPGSYRIDAIPGGGYVAITVRSGAADVAAGPQTAFLLPGQRLLLTGNPAALETLDALPPDAWDEWCALRDEGVERALDTEDAYVSWEVPGAEDLADSGDWTVDAEYGACWSPRYISADWAPFRNGHWIYKAPWGWTWVDAAPWGFAPSHFGRWTRIKHGWSWIPGHRHNKPVYSPATVAFSPDAVTGRVAWAPLAPKEDPQKGALRNRDAATAVEVTVFRMAKPVAAGRPIAESFAFTACAPQVDPLPESIAGGTLHPAKPDVEARTLPPPVVAVAEFVSPEPAPRVAVEDHRAPDPPPVASSSDSNSYTPPASRHSDDAPRHTDDSSSRAPDPPRHDSAPASPPPQRSAPAPPSTPAHVTVQEHHVESSHPAPSASRGSSGSSASGGSSRSSGGRK